MSSAPSATKVEKVLIVEDHEPSRIVLEMFMKSFGFAVVGAANVAAALKAADQHRISFVISDVGLPDGTGFELMKVLHHKYALPGISVSAYDLPEIERNSREAGFRAHVVKPASFETLLSVLTDAGLHPPATASDQCQEGIAQ